MAQQARPTTPSSQTFRLFSAPEAHVNHDDSGDLRIEVVGVDSFDASTGEVVSRSQNDIAAWFLDQDYDGPAVTWPLPWQAGRRKPQTGRSDGPKPRLQLIREGATGTRHRRWRPGA